MLDNPILTSGGLPAYPRLLCCEEHLARSALQRGVAAGRSDGTERLAAGGQQGSPDPKPLLRAEARHPRPRRRFSFQVHLASYSAFAS
jgi:hypothetical protein